MTPEKIISAKVTALTAKGLGICTIQDHKKLISYEVPYVLPGENIRISIKTQGKKNKAVVQEISSSSKARILPACPYYQRCGGCLLLHMNDATQTHFKLDHLKKILNDQRLSPRIQALQSLGPGARRRLRIEALHKSSGIFLGFRRYNSHQIINIDACYIADPIISKFLPDLKSEISQLLPVGQQATLHLTKAANGLCIDIDCETWNTSYQPNLPEHPIVRFTIQNHPLIQKNPIVNFGGIEVPLPEKSFLQASELSEKNLQNIVENALKSLKFDQNRPLLDLFCGLGTLSLPLHQTTTIKAYDLHGPSIEALNKAITSHSLKTYQAFSRDLILDPLRQTELNDFSACIINPPRMGLGIVQCQELSQSSLSKIIYVSCHPETFARDARTLTQGNFNLIEVFPVDQFYGSPHLEVVGIFDMKSL